MERDKKNSSYVLNLDYWKDYITIHNVLACELSYSLIYNNIRPEKIEEALATVGLTRLPNRFLLIQVDDYYNYSSKMQITQEFYQKTMLINLLRDCMDKLGLKGFMANLVGIDKSYVFCAVRKKKKRIYIVICPGLRNVLRKKYAATAIIRFLFVLAAAAAVSGSIPRCSQRWTRP